MKVKKLAMVFFLFMLSAVFCLFSIDGDLQEASQKNKEKSFIRKDLLLKESRKLKPPRRNIFSLQKIRFGENESWGDKQEEPGSIEGRQNIRMGQTGSEMESLLTSQKLRYIGYVCSDQKIVALIIFGGETLAVEEGEMIGDGIKISKIIPEEINIILPDSTKKAYSLEGEIP